MVMVPTWVVGEYNDCGGYDCMTGAIRVGPALLDGSRYGQDPCDQLPEGALKQMQQDAHLIAAAPDMLAALQKVIEDWQNYVDGPGIKEAQEAIAKAIKWV